MASNNSPNFDSDDFYQVLGVSRNSQEKDIKKAYKKLSLKYHPDKNPNNKEEAEEIFKKISFAYGILGDAQKRKDYDTYGRDYVVNGGAQANGGGGGGSSHFRGGFSSGPHNFNMHSAEEIFRNFFGGRDPFANFFDDEEDDFFNNGFPSMGGGFGQMGFGSMHNQGGNRMANRDPFGGFGMSNFENDDFFSGGFGGGMGGGMGGNFSSFQSSSFGMGGGMGESISTSTVIENGR